MSREADTPRTEARDGENPALELDVALERYSGKTILITGGRGYIGAALTQRLAAVDCELVLWDHAELDVWQPAQVTGQVRYIQGDVMNTELWSQAAAGVDFIFHLASLEHRQGSELNAERDLAVNATATLLLLEACRQNDVEPRIVFASSANLYGAASTLPVNEETPDDPLTFFATHKLASENYLRMYKGRGGAVSLRLANVYGPTPRQDRRQQVVVNLMVARAMAGSPLQLYANQNCVRDYIFLDDVVAAFLLAGQLPKSSSGTEYVIGSEEATVVGDLVRLVAERVEEKTGRAVAITDNEGVQLETAAMRNFVADCGRYRCVSGWKPKTSLREGIDKTVEALA